MPARHQQLLFFRGLPVGISGTPVTTGIEYEHGIGSIYAGFTATASNGTTPYTYSVLSGTLPSGITLNSSTGAVSGTPAFQSAGTYSGIVIRVTDNVGATADLAPFTLTISYKDPYYSNTKLLIDHDAADGSTIFTDASAAARGNGNAGGNVQHDTGVSPPYGTSWYLFDGATDLIRFGDSNDWNLGTQNFTLDVVIRPNNVTGTHFWFGQWENAPNLNFVWNQNGTGVQLNISTTGSNNLADVSAAAALVINTTYHFRLDFDGTKYRMYKNGVMVASSTTLRSLFTGSSLQLAIGASSTTGGFGFSGHMKGIRITVGTARTASDSGYTISNRALPTS
jgi:Concanavalin A-like lectin/glucanases superfamily/Putative Ig domain